MDAIPVLALLLAIVVGSRVALDVESVAAAPADSTGASAVPAASTSGRAQLAGVSRWRMLDAFGVEVPRHPLWDPYNQNVLKGDIAAFGSHGFAVLTGIGTSNALPSSRSKKVTDVKSKGIVALELFGGATVFRPKDWSLRVSGQGVANHGDKPLNEFALLEGFGEVKLFDVGQNFDFTSVRGGVQPFNSDFDGLVFKDINLGGQLFGELAQNRFRWAAAYFDQRAKTKGGGVSGKALEQQVIVANLVAEDFLSPGFNAVFSVQHNADHSVKTNHVDVAYIGAATAGHWGRIRLNPAFYYAFGSEMKNPIAGVKTSVSAYLAGAQFAYPSNYLTYRAAAFVASADHKPGDDKATGFDSINDNVNLFGGDNSFLIGTASFFTRANSFLPSHRTQGIANFVNPGILLVNAGADVVVTPKLLLQFNYNNARFGDTASLPGGSGPSPLARSIGQELNAVANFRAFLSENLVLRLGGNVLFPATGGKKLLGSGDAVVSGNLGVVLVY